MYIARTQKSDDRPTNPGWNLSDDKQSAHVLCNSAIAKGVSVADASAMATTLYPLIDRATTDGRPAASAKNLIAVAAKALDAMVPAVAFTKSDGTGPTATVSPEGFFSQRPDGGWIFDLAGYFAAVRAARGF